MPHAHLKAFTWNSLASQTRVQVDWSVWQEVSVSQEQHCHKTAGWSVIQAPLMNFINNEYH